MRTKVVSLVYYEHQAGEYVTPHNHNYHEMVFYFKGNGHVNVNSEMHTFEEGSVFIVKPQDVHDELSTEFSVVFIVLFEIIEGSNINNIFTKYDKETSEHIYSLFQRAIQEYRDQEHYYQEYVNHLFNIILLEALRQTESISQKSSDTYVKHAKKYMLENHVQKIDFNMLAKSSGYSYDRFRHIFKEATGLTLLQYLLNVRLEHAKQLLGDTEESISDIAQQCGFASTTHFVNFFSTRVNLSPLRYRNMLKEQDELGVVNIKTSRNEEI